MPRWTRRAPLGLAMLLFVGLAWVASDRMMATSEELISITLLSQQVVAPTPTAPAPDGRITFEPSCADAGRAGHLLLSRNRPTLAFCAGGRTYPILAAPQYAALFTMPVGLFASLTRGDVFLVRRLLLLPLGLLALFLAHRVIARLANEVLAAWAALGMAVSPCFVLLYSYLQPYEVLPWIFTLAALDVLLGCTELAPATSAEARPSTRRLGLTALLVGLGALANIKELFYVVPLVLLALRLRVRFGRIRPEQWALVSALVLLPLLPMAIPLVLDPSMSFAQGRGGNWIAVLADTIRRPQKIVDAARELVVFWSGFGALLAGKRPNLVSTAVAGVVLLSVLADTARTLLRRRGCAVTAACGLVLVTYLLVLTFLYRDFPPNYLPLHAVYGIALGAFADRLVTTLRARGWLPRGAAPATAALLLVPFLWSTRQTIDDVANLPFVTNAHAERELARYLTEHADPPAVPITTSLLMGGVVDSLTAERVRTVQAHPLIDDCRHGGGDSATAPANERCLYDAFHALFASLATTEDVRVVFSASFALLRRSEVLRTAQREQMERAAHDLGLTFRLEETFHTPDRTPAIELYRVRR